VPSQNTARFPLYRIPCIALIIFVANKTPKFIHFSAEFCVNSIQDKTVQKIKEK